MYKVLIIDDEKDICFLISEILKDEKYMTYTAQNSDEAIAIFNKNIPDLVILDVWLSNSKLDGIEILKEFKNINKNIPIIIISGHGTVDLAVSAIKNGAYDFLEKPFNSDKLIILSNRAIENSKLKNENKTLNTKLFHAFELVGKSSNILSIKDQINKLSKSDVKEQNDFNSSSRFVSMHVVSSIFSISFDISIAGKMTVPLLLSLLQ